MEGRWRAAEADGALVVAVEVGVVIGSGAGLVRGTSKWSRMKDRAEQSWN